MKHETDDVRLIIHDITEHTDNKETINKKSFYFFGGIISNLTFFDAFLGLEEYWKWSDWMELFFQECEFSILETTSRPLANLKYLQKFGTD